MKGGIRTRELIIDAEFQCIIPALTDAEFAQLEANILEEGRVRDALIVWNDTIIDGHNRWRIIQEHPDLPFSVEEMTFESRDEAILWMCNNQLGRRNLNDMQMENLTGRRYKAEKRLHGSTSFQGNQYTHDMQEKYAVSGQNVHSPKRTAQKIAEELGINEKTVRRAEKFVDGLNAAELEVPGITQDILSGKLPTTKKAVIAVGKEKDPVKRRELTEGLQSSGSKDSEPEDSADLTDSQDPPSSEESRKDKRDVYHSIEAISSAMEQVKEALSLDDVLETLKGAVQSFQATCDFYLEKYPELLTDQIYRKKTIAIMKEMQNYLKNI